MKMISTMKIVFTMVVLALAVGVNASVSFDGCGQKPILDATSLNGLKYETVRAQMEAFDMITVVNQVQTSVTFTIDSLMLDAGVTWVGLNYESSSGAQCLTAERGVEYTAVCHGNTADVSLYLSSGLFTDVPEIDGSIPSSCGVQPGSKASFYLQIPCDPMDENFCPGATLPSIPRRFSNKATQPMGGTRANTVDDVCVASAMGDPHITTFDGLKYDCQADGEVVLLKSLETTPAEFEIQGRFEKVSGAKNRQGVGMPSVTTGITVYDGALPTVQLSMSSLPDTESFAGCPVQVLVDGEPVMFRSFEETDDLAISSDEGKKTIIVSYKETDLEIRATVRQSIWDGTCLFGVSLFMFCDYRANERMGGLFGGTPNQNKNDDWMYSDGTPYPVPKKQKDRKTFQAYSYCTTQWCVRHASESLFTYEGNTTFGDYFGCDVGMDPELEALLDNPTEAMVEACGGDAFNLPCLIDAAFMGRQGAQDQQEDAANDLAGHVCPYTKVTFSDKDLGETVTSLEDHSFIIEASARNTESELVLTDAKVLDFGDNQKLLGIQSIDSTSTGSNADGGYIQVTFEKPVDIKGIRLFYTGETKPFIRAIDGDGAQTQKRANKSGKRKKRVFANTKSFTILFTGEGYLADFEYVKCPDEGLVQEAVCDQQATVDGTSLIGEEVRAYRDSFEAHDLVVLKEQLDDNVTFAVDETVIEEGVTWIGLCYLPADGSPKVCLEHLNTTEPIEYNARCIDGLSPVTMYVFSETLLGAYNIDSSIPPETNPPTVGGKKASFYLTLPCGRMDDRFCFHGGNRQTTFTSPRVTGFFNGPRKGGSRSGTNNNICTGSFTGDPHMTTFDGLKYDCQADGEVVLLKSMSSTPSTFEIQGRFTKVNRKQARNGVGSPSVTTGIVIYDEGMPTVQLSMSNVDGAPATYKNCPVQLYVNGLLQETLFDYNATQDVKIGEFGGSIIVDYPLTGVEVRAQVRGWQNNCLFSVQVRMHCDYRDNEVLAGLLGSNPNNDRSDDWMYNTGEPYGVPTGSGSLRFTEAYEYCTSQWCLTHAPESLFTYEPDKNFVDYYNCDFGAQNDLQNRVKNPTDGMLRACGGDKNNIACLIDAEIMGEEAAKQNNQDELAIRSGEQCPYKEVNFEDELTRGDVVTNELKSSGLTSVSAKARNAEGAMVTTTAVIINDKDYNNVLAIQDLDTPNPVAASMGGHITLEFKEPVDFKGLTILYEGEEAPVIKLTNKDNFVREQSPHESGELVTTTMLSVKTVVVMFTGEGSVAELMYEYCPEDNGLACCSHDFKTCINWCGNTEDACGMCKTDDYFQWQPEGDDKSSCKRRWSDCTNNPDVCCPGLICAEIEENYSECTPGYNGTAFPKINTTDYNDPTVRNGNQNGAPGSISGSVKDDQGNALTGVTVELLDFKEDTVDATTTDANGNYEFTNINPGYYTVLEENPEGYPTDVSDEDNSDDGDAFDADTTVDNLIRVTLRPGEHDSDNDFVDQAGAETQSFATISGTVKDEEGNTLPDATLTLKDSSGTILGTATTSTDGAYQFTFLSAGDYTVEETNPPGYPEDISDKDDSDDGDVNDSDTTVDNKIAVTLTAGETDSDNNFVDGKSSSGQNQVGDIGAITGSVKDDKGIALAQATIELHDDGDNIIGTVVTDSTGKYSFTNLPAGDYTVVETNPEGYPDDVSDRDNSNDGDASDTDATIDNTISVKLQPGETDADNDFVDKRDANYEDPSNRNTDNGEGGSFGDPHLKTWRGKIFDFHAECDLILVHSEQFGNGKGLDLHIRTEIRKNWSFIAEAVLRIGIETLEMDKDGVYYLNGQKNAPMPNTIGGYPITHSLTKKGRVSLDVDLGQRSHIFFREYKEFVSAHVVQGREEDFGDSVGLMGEFHTGRMLLRDGVRTEIDPKPYAEEWQVRDTDVHLFRRIRAPQFPQRCRWPSVSTLRGRRRLDTGVSYEDAVAACEQWGDDMEGCIFDVMATGDLEMASAGSW